eukprot:COSAG06_NODE_1563_length_9093_cov_9.891495_22_plen_83_part_00
MEKTLGLEGGGGGGGGGGAKQCDRGVAHQISCDFGRCCCISYLPRLLHGDIRLVPAANVGLQETVLLFECFAYVCPEPVLVK